LLLSLLLLLPLQLFVLLQNCTHHYKPVILSERSEARGVEGPAVAFVVAFALAVAVVRAFAELLAPLQTCHPERP